MDASERPPARAEMRRSDDAAPPSANTGSLVTGIIEDLQGIVRGEVQLAKTELTQDATAAAKGAATAAVGGFITYSGFIFLMLAVAFLISKWLDLWLATGIVAVALLVVGAIVLLIGKQRLSASSLTPDQTIASLKEDQQWANRQIKSVKQ